MDSGYAPLNDKTRAWILAAAKNDEDSLRRLLNENPEIYSTRDPSTGYTALHWAAKFGAEMLVHLLIGRYRLFFLRSILHFFTQIYMNCFVSS